MDIYWYSSSFVFYQNLLINWFAMFRRNPFQIRCRVWAAWLDMQRGHWPWAGNSRKFTQQYNFNNLQRPRSPSPRGTPTSPSLGPIFRRSPSRLWSSSLVWSFLHWQGSRSSYFSILFTYYVRVTEYLLLNSFKLYHMEPRQKNLLLPFPSINNVQNLIPMIVYVSRTIYTVVDSEVYDEFVLF